MQEIVTYVYSENDDVTNATRCSLWFKTEVISCEEWIIMTIRNELMVEVKLMNVIMHA